MLGVLSEGGMSQCLTALASSLFFKLQLSRRSELSSSTQCPSIRSNWVFLIKMSQGAGFLKQVDLAF